MAFEIVPIPASLCEEARRTGLAPGYGHPAHREVAAGYGPCRSCLEPFKENADRRLLFTYDPFRDIETLPLPGPVYIHDDGCSVYEARSRFPDSLRFIPMTLNGYGRGRHLRGVEYVESNGDVEKVISRLFHHPEIDYIHVRNTEAGCYLFRIDRTSS